MTHVIEAEGAVDAPDAGMAPRVGDTYTVYGNARPPPATGIVFRGEPWHSVGVRKAKKVLRNITLEPVMLFMSVVCKCPICGVVCS